jgi:uncharacterized phage-like protein YoqJ
MFANSVISDGQQFVKIEGQLTVELWITFHLKLLKGKDMMIASIFGASECWHMK